MRYSSLPALALGLAASLIGPHAMAIEIDAEELFALLDRDGDGQLTAEEAGKAHEELFYRTLRVGDEDADGKLSVEEFATGLTPVRAEKEMVEKQGSRLPAADALVVMLDKLDTSGDLELAPDEIPEQYSGMFAVLLARGDADKNGRLDERDIAQAGPVLALLCQAFAVRSRIDVAKELAKIPPERRRALERIGALAAPATLSPADRARQMFSRLDANGDKFVTPDEAPEGMKRLLRRGDRDGDGKLTFEELRAVLRRGSDDDRPAGGSEDDPELIRRRARELIGALDRDDDGVLTAEELPRPLAQAFDRIDADSSGAVDQGELGRYLKNAVNGSERGRPSRRNRFQRGEDEDTE